MRRREFITLVGAAALLYSSRSRAQKPANTYLIGYLAIAEIPYALKALKDGLRKLGYIEGQNLRVEYRIVAAGGASVDTLLPNWWSLGPISSSLWARQRRSPQNEQPRRYLS